ncbi:hypothetical protein CB0940_10970 [Cercospora beticola]|uniref:Uncharacterized protein n=1 Tax=Cercospora beticola TaxID=122368 RepID=A0A2G5HCS9_CERBT|nr:hypothetical protein CB0940_10970 [Cercospora beticola]PIA90350.1 hypothetical protein CB0940_10970 [Cercospora beticola]WPB07794.1 hypothetical protein RHO25_012458 [Cercospora beticola]CAK1368373.1 unnamed protein product [Cercospora beticola]
MEDEPADLSMRVNIAFPLTVLRPILAARSPAQVDEAAFNDIFWAIKAEASTREQHGRRRTVQLAPPVINLAAGASREDAIQIDSDDESAVPAPKRRKKNGRKAAVASRGRSELNARVSANTARPQQKSRPLGITERVLAAHHKAMELRAKTERLEHAKAKLIALRGVAFSDNGQSSALISRFEPDDRAPLAPHDENPPFHDTQRAQAGEEEGQKCEIPRAHSHVTDDLLVALGTD